MHPPTCAFLICLCSYYFSPLPTLIYLLIYPSVLPLYPSTHASRSRQIHPSDFITPSLALLIQFPGRTSLPLAAIQQASFHSCLFYQAPGSWRGWAELAHPGPLSTGEVVWAATNKWTLCSFADPLEMEDLSSGLGMSKQDLGQGKGPCRGSGP